MKKYKSLGLVLGAIFISLFSCSSGASTTEQEIEKKDTIQYTADYDDGQTIFINVKIAIDQKGWDSKTPDYFKTKLKEQWDQINARFNNCDRKHQLKRKYIFKPDLDNIVVYKGCSYWGENGANTKVIQQMDKNIFKLVVIYDFVYEGEENGEHGGGCGNDDGIGTILVINASDGMKNKYNDHFGIYTYRAITHELGHFRGVIDLYTAEVKGENNPVNGEGFTPINCLMNNYCYTPDEESSWSDYALKIINKTGNIKKANLIDELMYEGFPDKLVVNIVKNGANINAKISFYPASYSFTTWCNTISKTPAFVNNSSNGVLNIPNAKTLFYKDPNDRNARTQLFLVEAQDQNGVKKYAWISDYNMHNCGLDGNKTYTLTFEF